VFLHLQEQMTARLSTSREVIQHPGTKGAATELHWLNMLNDYLPKRYCTDSAFVVDCEGRLSDQIDIVLYDSTVFSLSIQPRGCKIHSRRERVRSI
jgi:hypothetical protein